MPIVIQKLHEGRRNSVSISLQQNLQLFSKSTTGTTPADSSFKPSGKLWGYSFGDYYYKAHADALSRSGANQYTGIEQGRNAFQIRRV